MKMCKIAAIGEGRQPYVDAYAGRRALELVLAIYKSQRDGISVKFSVQNFACEEMRGEFEYVYRY